MKMFTTTILSFGLALGLASSVNAGHTGERVEGETFPIVDVDPDMGTQFWVGHADHAGDRACPTEPDSRRNGYRTRTPDDHGRGYGGRRN